MRDRSFSPRWSPPFSPSLIKDLCAVPLFFSREGKKTESQPPPPHNMAPSPQKTIGILFGQDYLVRFRYYAVLWSLLFLRNSPFPPGAPMEKTWDSTRPFEDDPSFLPENEISSPPFFPKEELPFAIKADPG